MNRRIFLTLAVPFTLATGAVAAALKGGKFGLKCDCCCGEKCPMNKKDANGTETCCCKDGKCSCCK